MIDKSLGLDIPFPSLISQECYQLLHVGPLAHIPPLHYAITCYFQPWRHETFLTSNAEPIARQIDVRRAAHLIPGSLWDPQGKRYTSRHLPIPDYRQWFAGAQPYRIAQLQDVIGLRNLPLVNFWESQGSTWVAVFDYGEERILIPCFELLRFLYYHAGPRIIQYAFSQLSLDLLCRPHMSPTRDTKYQAQLYVAATHLTEPEARVLGGLSFDPIYLRTFNQAQAHWTKTHRSQGSGIQESIEERIYAKTAGQLGRNVLVRGEGRLFTHQQRAYFWVTSLTPLTSPHHFRSLLYHSLEHHSVPSQESVDFPICSDLLSYRHSKASVPRIKSDPLEPAFSRNGRVGPHTKSAYTAAASRSPYPAVERGPTWAREASPSKPLVWFDEQLYGALLTNHSVIEKHLPPRLDLFKRLLKSFASEGYKSKMLLINNPKQLFGSNVSVFPHRGFAPLPGPLYQHRVRRFRVAQIELGSGLFFILHFPHLPKLAVLCQKQNLSAPTETEWNRLLVHIHRIRSSSDIESFSAKYSLSIGHYGLGPGTSPLAHIVSIASLSTSLCLLFTDRTLACFRQRLALTIGLMCRYPAGVDVAHWNRITTTASMHSGFRSPTPEWVVQMRMLRKQQ